MKKWLVILALALLMTGCDMNQETDEKEEGPKSLVEMSVEPSEPTEETEETKETEESVVQTAEVLEATEETTESVQESTEPEEESTEVIESEASEETDESEESTEDSEETEDSEKIGYPWEMEELFPTSSEEEIPTELLEGMSVEDLERARHEIFWRNEEYDWYDEKELNPIEQQNVEKIKVLEGQKRLVVPVPTTDLVFFECYAAPWDECLGYGIYVYISGGDMYYCYDGNGSYIFGTYYCRGQIKKYTGLSNIKRLKTFNRGTDVNPCPCIITEEGEVYWVDFNFGSDGGPEIILERFEFLKDYQVEDILYYSGEWQHKVEISLKDGRIIYLESEPWG